MAPQQQQQQQQPSSEPPPSPKSPTSPLDTIFSFFSSVANPVPQRRKLSSHLASIHSAVDHELHPSYMADWERAFNTRYRSATTTSNDSSVSASSTFVVDGDVAKVTQEQQQQQGRLTKEALAWYWPEAAMEPAGDVQPKMNDGIPSVAGDPRRSAL